MTQTEQPQSHKQLTSVLWKAIAVLLAVIVTLVGLVWSDLKSDNVSVRKVMTALDTRIGNLEEHVRSREDVWTTSEHIRYDTELDEWRLDFERRLTRLETQRENP